SSTSSTARFRRWAGGAGTRRASRRGSRRRTRGADLASRPATRSFGDGRGKTKKRRRFAGAGARRRRRGGAARGDGPPAAPRSLLHGLAVQRDVETFGLLLL